MRKREQPTSLESTELSEKRDAFAAKLADGNYRDLFGKHITSIFSQATDELAKFGLAEEIGTLRVVLARLLAEEDDLNRLATNVARIASVMVRTVQTHHEITGHTTNVLIEELTKILAEIETDNQN